MGVSNSEVSLSSLVSIFWLCILFHSQTCQTHSRGQSSEWHDCKWFTMTIQCYLILYWHWVVLLIYERCPLIPIWEVMTETSYLVHKIQSLCCCILVSCSGCDNHYQGCQTGQHRCACPQRGCSWQIFKFYVFHFCTHKLVKAKKIHRLTVRVYLPVLSQISSHNFMFLNWLVLPAVNP